GHARAMNLAGRCLEEGWGCARDLAGAADWYRRSAESGYFRGQFNYALVLAEQRAVSEAAEWFWRAAQGGDGPIRRVICALLAACSDPRLSRTRLQVAALMVSDRQLPQIAR
ncbi:MAG TPA: hypothetical protein VIH80_07235, partial [Steroidobacteraceae bacterium]